MAGARILALSTTFSGNVGLLACAQRGIWQPHHTQRVVMENVDEGGHTGSDTRLTQAS